MTEFVFKSEQLIPAPLDKVFEFFSVAQNLQKLTPPFLDFKILTPQPIEMHEGTLIDYRITLYGVPMKWQTLIETWKPEVSFSDRQLKGPYKLWHHTHEFKAVGPNKTLMNDTVRYAVPFGPLGLIAKPIFVAPTIKKIFDYRTHVINETFS